MYNSIKKIVILGLCVFAICGCSSDKVKLQIQSSNYETENEIIDIEVPEFSKLGKKEFNDEISSNYETYSKDLLNSFIKDSQNQAENRVGKSKLEVKQEEKYNKNGLYSLISEIYEYTEGTYGVSRRRILNVDTENSKVLLLEDLFNDDEYIDMLNSKLEKLSEDSMYSDLWEKPVINEEQNEYFYFDNKGLVIFYPPYELSYYARGFVEFTIPYSELYGYLKPEYSVLYR